MPWVIKLCKKQGWYDRVNSRKVHSGTIPRLGSCAFVTVFLAAALLYLGRTPGNRLAVYLPILGGGFLVFVLGLLDDLYELPARYKLLGQGVASLIPLVCGLHLTRLGPLELGGLGPILTFCWLIGMSNAFNLIDGVDALCGILSLSVLLTLGLVLSLNGDADAGLDGALEFILGGCILGFLVYNKPPARIFMGDGGSQFLGFMIGALPLITSSAGLTYNLFPLVAVLSSIPLVDTIAAIWRRTREGRSFFTPDKRHLHHKLMEMGYTTKGLLGLILTIQTVLCGVSLVAVLWLGGFRGFIFLAAAFGAMAVFFAVIHYTSQRASRIKAHTSRAPEGRKTPEGA
ncbi:MAG: undecaprenyl/decaprenyl-phosphate alpha-N-acetylglucosaminyl 1-phosphate transferase [Treponema sp.]|jgi:UDP-GlcNAc:undecaprenyl-phosphate GlcNAc-1-phosphate transferase|nr:undecaprenyl/decaprenyl-phosphate alpha-N-acetylglucosaminyl 1-phosphate transferase [Treponema sp.]